MAASLNKKKMERVLLLKRSISFKVVLVVFTLSSALCLFTITRRLSWKKPLRSSSFFLVDAAMSTSTSKTHRILSYGDSLTAGTPGSGFETNMYPYAPHLESGLTSRGKRVMVRHRGMPGWTTQNMLGDLDGPLTGLRSAIRAVKDPSLSLVIILAGSNDIGFGFKAEEITDNIIKLHEVAWENGVPRTIAIGIPPSGYQSLSEDARNLAKEVNANLERMCTSDDDSSSSSRRATFMPFPFVFERDGENWDPDTLHFSPKGYQVLGESLIPVVETVLDDLDKE